MSQKSSLMKTPQCVPWALTSDTGNNQLYGLGDDDVLSGGAGSDKLYGGGGDDTLDGGSGGDLYIGGGGADIFKYTAATDSGSTTAAADRIGDFNSAQGDKIQFTSDGFGASRRSPRAQTTWRSILRVQTLAS